MNDTDKKPKLLQQLRDWLRVRHYLLSEQNRLMSIGRGVVSPLDAL